MTTTTQAGPTNPLAPTALCRPWCADHPVLEHDGPEVVWHYSAPVYVDLSDGSKARLRIEMFENTVDHETEECVQAVKPTPEGSGYEWEDVFFGADLSVVDTRAIARGLLDLVGEVDQ